MQSENPTGCTKAKGDTCVERDSRDTEIECITGVDSQGCSSYRTICHNGEIVVRWSMFIVACINRVMFSGGAVNATMSMSCWSGSRPDLSNIRKSENKRGVHVMWGWIDVKCF